MPPAVSATRPPWPHLDAGVCRLRGTRLEPPPILRIIMACTADQRRKLRRYFCLPSCFHCCSRTVKAFVCCLSPKTDTQRTGTEFRPNIPRRVTRRMFCASSLGNNRAVSTTPRRSLFCRRPLIFPAQAISSQPAIRALWTGLRSAPIRPRSLGDRSNAARLRSE